MKLYDNLAETLEQFNNALLKAIHQALGPQYKIYSASKTPKKDLMDHLLGHGRTEALVSAKIVHKVEGYEFEFFAFVDWKRSEIEFSAVIRTARGSHMDDIIKLYPLESVSTNDVKKVIQLALDYKTIWDKEHSEY